MSFGSPKNALSLQRQALDTLPTGLLWGFIAFLALLAAAFMLDAKLTSLLVFAAFAGTSFMLFSYRYPELGVLALIALTSSFLPSDIVDLRLPIGGGLDLRDLALLALLATTFLKQMHSPSLHKLSWHAAVPLVLFLGWALHSALYALFYLGVESNWVFNELRIVMYYSVFFLTALACQKREQIDRLIWGLLVLANLTTLLVVAQQFFSASSVLSQLLTGLDWIVWTQGDAEGFGSLRIIPPGHVLVYFMSIIAFVRFSFVEHKNKARLFWFAQFCFLNFGLLISFTRAQWLASIIALAIISVALLPYYRRFLAQYILPLIALFMLLIGIFGQSIAKELVSSSFYQSLETRVISIFRPSETSQTYSLQWRVFETQEAFKAIARQPYLGVSLGNNYREPTILQGEVSGHFTRAVGVSDPFRFTRYVHNSFLFIAVKLGLVGTVFLLWFMLDFAFLAYQQFRERPDSYSPRHRSLKGLSLAILAAFMGLLLWAVFHSHLMETESTSVIGLMTGLVLCLYMQAKPEPLHLTEGKS